MLVNRGYTGHEHIDAFNIINMNGRMYDPFTASFLSPDPYIQAPDNWINYNRYGYCMFNPFMYTDPSGYSWFSQFGNWISKNWKTVVVVAATVVVAVAVTVCTAGTATPLLVGIYAGAAAGFTGGVVGTALNGGSFMDCLGAGIMGAFQGALFGGAGAYAATLAPAGALWGSLYGAGTGSLLGGTQSAVNGGDFWDGVKLGAALGAVGGAAQGYSSAKAQGLNPWTGTKLPENTVNTPIAPAATQNAANKPANTNTAPAETPTTNARAEVQTAVPDNQPAVYKDSYLHKVSGNDGQHVWNRHSVEIVVDNGQIFQITGGDGKPALLIQQIGTHHGYDGVFEMIFRNGEITHQRFIPGGTITGLENQIVPNVPGSAGPSIQWWK